MKHTEQQNAAWWIGHKVLDQYGSKIGSVGAIYLDEVSRQPEWLAIETGFFGNKLSFAPIAGATTDSGEELVLPCSKDTVKGAPKFDPDGSLEGGEVEALRRYYNHPATTASEGEFEEEPSRDTMTRTEEEVTVGKAIHERGRVRLRKYVVTEDVAMTVPLKHEEVRIEREPITNGSRGEIGPEEQEVVLHEEEPVVQKRAVAKEKFHLGKTVVTDERNVSERVRKEKIEVDEDDAHSDG